MKICTRTERNMGLQVLGVILFIVGALMLLAFPIGTILGILIIIGAARIGHKEIRVQKCQHCGYFFQI